MNPALPSPFRNLEKGFLPSFIHSILHSFLLSLLLSLCLFAGSLQAQDPVYDQFYANKLYLNPAFTGYEQGVNIYLQNRHQWVAVDQWRTFNNQSVGVSMDMPRLQSGFGLIYDQSREGIMPLQWQRVGFQYAFRTRSCRKSGKRGKRSLSFPERFDLSLGFRITQNSRRVVWEDYLFSDELHHIYGDIYNSQIQAPAMNFSEGNYFDLDAGIIVDYELMDNQFGAQYLRVGAAFNHLNRANNSVFGLNDTLSWRLTLHGTYILQKGNANQKNWDAAFLFKLDLQKSSPRPGTNADRPVFLYNSLDMGVAFSYYNLPRFFGGTFLHMAPRGYSPGLGNNLHALSFLLGYEFELGKEDNTIRLGLSRSLDFTGLRSSTGSSWEASIVISFKNAQAYSCTPRIPCGRF
jgi:type IX secretion system PorP/SprF family membrane protein